MLSFTDALNDARKKALLTGMPLTNQDKQGIQSGWFDMANAMGEKERAQKLAEDKLKLEQQMTQEQIDAAKKGQVTGTISNVANNVVGTLGTNYLTAKPGESLIAKGAGAVKNLFTGTGTAADMAVSPFATGGGTYRSRRVRRNGFLELCANS